MKRKITTALFSIIAVIVMIAISPSAKAQTATPGLALAGTSSAPMWAVTWTLVGSDFHMSGFAVFTSTDGGPYVDVGDYYYGGSGPRVLTWMVPASVPSAGHHTSTYVQGSGIISNWDPVNMIPIITPWVQDTNTVNQ